MWYPELCKYKRDLCSNEHYLSSSEDKAWKNSGLYRIWTHNLSIPVQRSTNWANKPTGSWSICWFQHIDLAQLVEHCINIAEVMGSNPVQAWIFFRPYFHWYSSRVHFISTPLLLHTLFSYIHSHLSRIIKVKVRVSSQGWRLTLPPVCRLQTGGKALTGGKMQTEDCRTGVKCRLGSKTTCFPRKTSRVG